MLLNGTVPSLNEDEVVKSKDHCKENIQGNQADVDFHTIIIDSSCWSFVDTMGVTCLTAVSIYSMNYLFSNFTSKKNLNFEKYRDICRANSRQVLTMLF